MKRKRAIAIILAGILCLSGCMNPRTLGEKFNKIANGNKDNKKDEEKKEMQAYRTPTEKEWEILEGCNLSDDYIKKIKEKGMSMSVQSFVDTAQIMLDYLTEKYGEEFEVRGGEIPGIISGDYMIFASAVDGEYAGERFEVYYRTDEEGKGYCEDGYFAIIKNEEIQLSMQKQADKMENGWKVFTKLGGVYGKEFRKETDIATIEPEELVVQVRCIMTPEKEFEDYKIAQKKIMEEWKHEGYKKSIFYCQFVNLSQWKDITSFSTAGNILKQHSDENPIYQGRVVE